MLPVLAAIGVSLLSSLASKAAASLIERSLGGGAASDSGAPFHSILERSQATQSSRTVPRPADVVARATASMATDGGFVQRTALSSGLMHLALRTPHFAPPVTVAARPVGGAGATGYVGRKVAANGSLVTLAGGVTPQLRYHLPRAAASVRIEVLDLHGQLVRTMDLGSQAGGQHLLPFDGRGLPPGAYVYRVVASDNRGEVLAGVSTAFGRVMAMQFEGGKPFLVVGSSLVPLPAIYEVSRDQRPAFS